MLIFVSVLILRAHRRITWHTLTPAQRSLLIDATFIVFLFLLALILRLPYLHDVPRYPWDELRESGVALSLARGEAFPLTNFDSYIGALYNYILAGAFFVSSGILFYLYLADVSVPLLATGFVETPQISGARSIIHFVLFLLCFYFGFVR